MKSCLHSEQQVRQLQAITMMTFRISSQSMLVTAAKEAMQKIQATQKAWKDKSDEEKQHLGELNAWNYHAV
eukprot:5878407-Karenia_brevis.AAC.1